MLLILLLLSFLSRPTLAVEKQSLVTVSGYIGKNQVTINGYTTPDSRVELSSPRVFDVAYSNSEGYFEFDRSFLPENPSDLCLTSIDNSSRRSHPVCIPPPPESNFITEIGPILLPPTLSLDADQIKPNSTALASGQSIPESTVNIYLYQIDSQAPTFPKEAQAFSLPQFTVATDSSGNYSFSLPTSYASNYRLFAAAIHNSSNTPKSNTLTYNLPTLFYLFWLQYKFLILFLPLFFLTLSFFVYLLFSSLKSPARSSRFLPALRQISLLPLKQA
ncbi:MAG: hypothetical protein ACOX6N_00790 [Patescibacteria group bacterium]|jgi:hypothetical protein